MKIRAGLKLHGRKPTHTPTAITATSGAMFEPLEEAVLEQPVGVEEQRGAGDDHDARGEAVEPVDEVDRVGEHHDHDHGDERREVGRQHDDVREPANGTRKNSIETPNSESRLPASTIPAILAGGDTSRRSSSAPTANITPGAEDAARPARTSRRTSRGTGRICDATAIATRKPTNIAAPPSVGIGFVCTPRGLGGDDRADADREPADERRQERASSSAATAKTTA